MQPLIYVGIDAVIWEQAKVDNPDKRTLIPVPMIGFENLRNRLTYQEIMAKQHQSRLDVSVSLLLHYAIYRAGVSKLFYRRAAL